MSNKVKVNGAWKNSTQVSVKVGGAWKPALNTYVKTSAGWKQTFKAPAIDSFTKTTAGSLGSTKDNVYPWVATRGTWYANGSQAQSDDLETNYSIASVNMGSSDAFSYAAVTGGTGVAFWVQDANNWFGAYSYQVSQQVSGSNAYSCNFQCAGCTGGGTNNHTGYTGGCGGYDCNGNPTHGDIPAQGDTMNCSQNSNCGGSCSGTQASGVVYHCYQTDRCSQAGGWLPDSSSDLTCLDGCWWCDPPCPRYCTACYTTTNYVSCSCPCYNATSFQPATYDCNNCGCVPSVGWCCCQLCYQPYSYTNYYYYVRILQSVNGVVTVVSDTALSAAAAVVSVETSGGSYTARAYSDVAQSNLVGSVTATPGPQTATSYGILKAPTSYGQGSTVDDVFIGV